MTKLKLWLRGRLRGWLGVDLQRSQMDLLRQQISSGKTSAMADVDTLRHDMLVLLSQQNDTIAALQEALKMTGETIEGAANALVALESRIVAQDGQIADLKMYQHDRSIRPRPVLDFEQLQQIRFIEAVAEEDKEKMQ